VEAGHDVIGTDIQQGQDFLQMTAPNSLVDMVITNPPYSLKNECISHCSSLGKP